MLEPGNTQDPVSKCLPTGCGGRQRRSHAEDPPVHVLSGTYALSSLRFKMPCVRDATTGIPRSMPSLGRCACELAAQWITVPRGCKTVIPVRPQRRRGVHNRMFIMLWPHRARLHNSDGQHKLPQCRDPGSPDSQPAAGWSPGTSAFRVPQVTDCAGSSSPSRPD